MDNERFGTAIALLVEQLDYDQRLFLARRALLGIKPEDRVNILNSLVQLAAASRDWRARQRDKDKMAIGNAARYA